MYIRTHTYLDVHMAAELSYCTQSCGDFKLIKQGAYGQLPPHMLQAMASIALTGLISCVLLLLLLLVLIYCYVSFIAFDWYY